MSQGKDRPPPSGPRDTLLGEAVWSATVLLAGGTLRTCWW